MTVLWPTQSDSVSYDQGKLILVSALKQSAPQLTVSTQWSVERPIDLSTEDARNNFAREFFKLIPSGATLQRFTFVYRTFQGYAEPDTLQFRFRDTVTLRALWQDKRFYQLAKDIKTTEALEILISLRGWRDTSYAPVYDDPANDARTLYKIHVKLIPGMNRIIFRGNAQEGAAAEYQTRFVMESKPTTDRDVRFHNSALEQNCTTCHEGLPSADSGKTMKADCAVCHKAMSAGMYLHSPVEMKECGSCHSWSAEKKAVVLEQGVPNTCYTCHDDKQKQVENSPTPHPVAGECLTCHSPHGSEQQHILKEDIYSLCTGCHEDQKENHPVGRHPVRFKKVKQTGEEISCVSCHNPHGSPNEHLLVMAGGPMEVCTKCH
ncbi:MAG TPA: cytochrome c3 family protein [Bacteroidota bacterium]|nr:cytochrome c3 family protein [Bacteroidota bacterium]